MGGALNGTPDCEERQRRVVRAVERILRHDGFSVQMCGCYAETGAFREGRAREARIGGAGGKVLLEWERYVWSGVNRRDAPLAWLKGFCGKAALKRTRRLAYKREELCAFRQGSSLVGRSAFPAFPRRGVSLGRKRRHFGADVLRGARQSDMIEA